MTAREKDALRLLLIGATGAGKTSTGNTIFRANDEVEKNMFKPGSSGEHNTTSNAEITKELFGRQVTVVDTPGLRNQREVGNVYEEIRSAIKNSEESYDALLLNINIFKDDLIMDELTENVLKDISSKISSQFWKFTVIVFTYEDNYWELQKIERGEECEPQSVRDYVNESITSTKKGAVGPYVAKVGIDAVASVDNSEKKDKEKIKKQVKQLLEVVDSVRKKNQYGKFGKEHLKKQGGCNVM